MTLLGEAGMPGPMGIGPFERLKPDAGRLASPVLRGRGIGNGLLLPDYLNEYASPREARERITAWFQFYNTESGRDSPLLSRPPLGTGQASFSASGSSRYEALDCSRAGCFPQTLCFPRVPPKRVSSSLRVLTASFRAAKYGSHSG